jgi:hypothetical protein
VSVGDRQADPNQRAFTPHVADIGGTPLCDGEEGVVARSTVKLGNGATWRTWAEWSIVDPSHWRAAPRLAKVAGTLHRVEEDAGPVRGDVAL